LEAGDALIDGCRSDHSRGGFGPFAIDCRPRPCNLRALSVPKKHHYLPEFHLKGYCPTADLWVYDREKDERRKMHPQTAAIRRDFYTVEGPDGKRDHAEVERRLGVSRTLSTRHTVLLCRGGTRSRLVAHVACERPFRLCVGLILGFGARPHVSEQDYGQPDPLPTAGPGCSV
jgi:hypothetical protein